MYLDFTLSIKTFATFPERYGLSLPNVINKLRKHNGQLATY